MKNLLFICIVLFCCSCTAPTGGKNSEKEQPSSFSKMDWLVAKWVRINDEEGKTTYEFWKKKSEIEFSGLGFTLQKTDTVFKENLRLVLTKGNWQLEVRGIHPDPTIFILTAIDSTGFIAENPDNEFPKKIQYSLDNKKLKAIISGGGPEILFKFEKLNP